MATRSLIPPWHPAVVDQDQHSRVPEISWIRFTLDLFDYLVPEVSLIRFVWFFSNFLDHYIVLLRVIMLDLFVSNNHRLHHLYICLKISLIIFVGLFLLLSADHQLALFTRYQSRNLAILDKFGVFLILDDGRCWWSWQEDLVINLVFNIVIKVIFCDD